MKIGYIRYYGEYTFIIPEEDIKDFDNIVDQLEYWKDKRAFDSMEYQGLVGMLHDGFTIHIVEDNITSFKIIIEE